MNEIKQTFKYNIDGGHYHEIKAKNYASVKKIVKLRNPKAKIINVKRDFEHNEYHTYKYAVIN